LQKVQFSKLNQFKWPEKWSEKPDRYCTQGTYLTVIMKEVIKNYHAYKMIQQAFHSPEKLLFVTSVVLGINTSIISFWFALWINFFRNHLFLYLLSTFCIHI
jgi:hypothetical protein